MPKVFLLDPVSASMKAVEVADTNEVGVSLLGLHRGAADVFAVDVNWWNGCCEAVALGRGMLVGRPSRMEASRTDDPAVCLRSFNEETGEFNGRIEVVSGPVVYIDPRVVRTKAVDYTSWDAIHDNSPLRDLDERDAGKISHAFMSAEEHAVWRASGVFPERVVSALNPGANKEFVAESDAGGASAGKRAQKL